MLPEKKWKTKMLNFDAKFKSLTFGTHRISFDDEDKNNYDVVIEVGKPKIERRIMASKLGQIVLLII